MKKVLTTALLLLASVLVFADGGPLPTCPPYCVCGSMGQHCSKFSQPSKQDGTEPYPKRTDPKR